MLLILLLLLSRVFLSSRFFHMWQKFGLSGTKANAFKRSCVCMCVTAVANIKNFYLLHNKYLNFSVIASFCPSLKWSLSKIMCEHSVETNTSCTPGQHNSFQNPFMSDFQKREFRLSVAFTVWQFLAGHTIIVSVNFRHCFLHFYPLRRRSLYEGYMSCHVK